MSIEAHPNINAAGFTADVIAALIKYSRGAMVGSKALTPRTSELISNFAVVISEVLDLEARGFYTGLIEAMENQKNPKKP